MKPVVLMYHGIVSPESPAPLEREEGAHLYDVSRENFSSQMTCLTEEDFNVCGIDDAAAEGKRNIVITFDDGESNNIRNAFPVLRRLGFTAYFFIVAGRIGKKGYMNWEELKELRDANMVVGSHSLTHRILTELKDKDIEKELVESKLLLETHLKINIDCFSVPRGFYNQKTLDMAQKNGYKRIFVSDIHADAALGCTGRVAVRHDWTVGRFKQALEGKTPTHEVVSDSIKSSAKNILGTKNYNWIRSMFVKQPKNPNSASGKREI